MLGHLMNAGTWLYIILSLIQAADAQVVIYTATYTLVTTLTTITTAPPPVFRTDEFGSLILSRSGPTCTQVAVTTYPASEEEAVFSAHDAGDLKRRSISSVTVDGEPVATDMMVLYDMSCWWDDEDTGRATTTKTALGVTMGAEVARPPGPGRSSANTLVNPIRAAKRWLVDPVVALYRQESVKEYNSMYVGKVPAHGFGKRDSDNETETERESNTYLGLDFSDESIPWDRITIVLLFYDFVLFIVFLLGLLVGLLDRYLNFRRNGTWNGNWEEDRWMD
ncbi:hypothetical protein P152DRAFT_470416 [Eremomyces bilateralis CBS 781.70]|uniref:Uncharacterized protein n=1 Tax=Eremomyces bilateralis CBS 781.70 TaxID=1392243 RepID=A0A6G1GEA4_9PEZI|nr:uncharacterized protein P152DRAFT_470416 [Eremomyces bilateralis CBS 781.70]KAF1816388.1 hypothetical protein P152DRAFT_470416 [Eremomyces bilateralis CBS 781.70]